MDAETHPAQEHDFGNAQWVDLGGYNPAHSPPIHDFSGFVFGSSPVMPMESSYSMSVPQPYSSQPMLPMTMSSQWPGMMSSQSGFAPVPLAPMPPMPTMGTPQPMQNSHYPTHPTPRRTLSDNDRRNMCRFHEENPNVKQTEIGAIFGVERSTVSKVLRQKEKYLNQDDSSRSPVKKSRGMFHDIEKKLANWVREQERQGHQISDAMIREKALVFANTAGRPESHQKITSASWLSTFKQKNCLSGSSPKSISLNTASGLESSSNEHPVDQTPNGLSPGSPSATTMSSPVSPKQAPYGESRRDSVHSTTRADGQEFTQHLGASQVMSRSPSVPNSATGLFASENPFSPSDQSNEPNCASNTSRPRSQTFPVTCAEAGLATNGSSAHASPMLATCQTSMATSTINDEDHSPMEPTNMKRNHSNPEIKITTMQPPPLPKSNTISPVSCSPDSPTQDEARRALELVMNYFQNQPSGLVAQDYFTIGKLMERLELAQNQVVAQARSLQRIDEYPDGPRVSKKRSIHTI